MYTVDILYNRSCETPVRDKPLSHRQLHNSVHFRRVFLRKHRPLHVHTTRSPACPGCHKMFDRTQYRFLEAIKSLPGLKEISAHTNHYLLRLHVVCVAEMFLCWGCHSQSELLVLSKMVTCTMITDSAINIFRNLLLS